MKELIFQKELMLTKQANQKNAICHYWYFKYIGYKFEPYVCNDCNSVLMIAYELKKYCNTECKRC